MNSKTEVDFMDELECWLICYGQPLTLGLRVRTTPACQFPDFIGGEFMITSIFFDEEGVNIGINDDGQPDDFKTAYDEFRIHELELIK